MNTVLSFVRSYTPGFQYIEALFKDSLLELLKTGPIPSHMSFVMDGNRRYAKRLGLPLKEGHRAGSESLAEVLECCYRVGVKQVTIYAFSIENFNRPQAEVETLFGLLKAKLAYVSGEKNFCDKLGCRIKIIGNRSMIPSDVLTDIETIEKKTSHHDQCTLFIALPYTSRDDIAHSMTSIVQKVKEGDLKLDDITEEGFENNFYYEGTAEKVDILVRTSGHTRLSDYMLWQCHQESTIEYSNELWPDYRFYSVWLTIFKWSYYKTLIIQDAESMQIKKIDASLAEERYTEPIRSLNHTHPPYASVTKIDTA